jgi:uncharacterized protein YutE (UPF0331/DUF86 family)
MSREMELVKSDNETKVHEIENVLLQLSHELGAWRDSPKRDNWKRILFFAYRSAQLCDICLSIATKLIIKPQSIGVVYKVQTDDKM